MKKLLIIALLFVGCAENTTESHIKGCIYEDACNYNADATSDDGSCIFGYIDNCGVCGGDGTSCGTCSLSIDCGDEPTRIYIN